MKKKTIVILLTLLSILAYAKIFIDYYRGGSREMLTDIQIKMYFFGMLIACIGMIIQDHCGSHHEEEHHKE